MTDNSAEQSNESSLAHQVQEVQGHFPDNAAIQDALGRLTIAGYDRADFSLPDEQSAAMPTPNETAENPTDEIDQAQLRTMGTGMAGFAGAAAAGGAIIATGGAAAIAAAAAAVAGVGSAGIAGAAGRAADHNQEARHNERGAAGTLILAVRTTSPEEVEEVTALMQQSGGTDIRRVEAGENALTAGVSSASWTGS